MNKDFRFSSDLWTSLEATTAAHPETAARRVLTTLGGVTVYAQYHRPSGQKAVKFEFPRRMAAQQLPLIRSKGMDLRIEPKEKSILDNSSNVDRLSVSPLLGDDSMFEAVVSNLIDLVVRLADSPDLIIELGRRIKDWQEMLSRPPLKTPTVNEMVGLYGEMAFLRDFMIPRLGPEAGVDAWMGPISNAKDFQHNGHAFEIKTSRSGAPDAVQIANFRQLDMEENERLHLVLIRLTDDRHHGESLLEVFEKLCVRLSEHPKALDRFKMMVNGAGWSNESLFLAPADIRFRVDSREFFVVEGDFPRYTKRDIKAGTLPGSYNITINACRPFITDEGSVAEHLAETHA
ncbi:PD-(D/E)XK motif protein [Agrobacterium salinitolerans]|nr:PD-(D/E)XK motif protein [Agrobacterium salinitolerans]